MPELPDVEIYVEALRARIAGQELLRARVYSPFLMRSANPPLETAQGGGRSARFGDWESGSRSASRAICGWCCT